MCISLERMRARMLISLRKQQNVNYPQRVTSKVLVWQITLLCNIRVSIHLHGRWSQKLKTLQIAPIWNKINATWITDLCLNLSLLVGHYYVEIKKAKTSSVITLSLSCLVLSCLLYRRTWSQCMPGRFFTPCARVNMALDTRQIL